MVAATTYPGIRTVGCAALLAVLALLPARGIAAGADEDPYLWRLEIRRDRLDNDTPDWQAYTLDLQRRWDSVRVTASLAAVERFESRDTEAGLAVGGDLGKHWFGEVAATSVASATFLPRHTAGASLGRRLGNGWVASARWQRRSYADDHVDLTSVTAERYVANWRFAYTLSGAVLASERALSHGLAADYLPDSGYRWGLRVGGGEEIEAVGVGELLRTDVWSVALIGQVPWRHGLSVGWVLGTHDQGSLYRRHFLGLSLSGGF